MIDKTTAGYTAEPEEVEAVLHNLCGYHLTERDALLRYEALTREQVLYDALVDAIRRERGRAVAEILAAGHKITQVAELTKLGTRQRVQRLVAIAKAAETAAEEAALAAQAAAAEAEVARDLGAAVMETVHELAEDGYFEVPRQRETSLQRESSRRDELPSGWADELADAENYPAADLTRPDATPQEPWFERPRLDPDADSALVEATMIIPVIVEPTRHTSEVSWWRRNRDNARSA